jgi:TPR repeat protein
MRVFIAVLFLIFSLNSLSNADQKNDLIRDANEGDAIAQNNLGFNYLLGLNGFTKDTDKAIKYLNLAAEQEQVNAMTTVGWTYFTGEFGAPKDDEEAIYWNQRASDLGCATASYNMGFFYYSGFVGLDQNLTTAKKYWLLSASQYLDNDNICEAPPDELLQEINDYNPNPTDEMIQLRNFFINLLKSIEA